MGIKKLISEEITKEVKIDDLSITRAQLVTHLI